MWRFASGVSSTSRDVLVSVSLLPSNLETVSGTIGWSPGRILANQCFSSSHDRDENFWTGRISSSLRTDISARGRRPLYRDRKNLVPVANCVQLECYDWHLKYERGSVLRLGVLGKIAKDQPEPRGGHFRPVLYDSCLEPTVVTARAVAWPRLAWEKAPWNDNRAFMFFIVVSTLGKYPFMGSLKVYQLFSQRYSLMVIVFPSWYCSLWVGMAYIPYHRMLQYMLIDRDIERWTWIPPIKKRIENDICTIEYSCNVVNMLAYLQSRYWNK